MGVYEEYIFRVTRDSTLPNSTMYFGFTCTKSFVQISVLIEFTFFQAKWKDKRERNQFESIFHNLDYSTLCEVMQGLRNAIGLLIEVSTGYISIHVLL